MRTRTFVGLVVGLVLMSGLAGCTSDSYGFEVNPTPTAKSTEVAQEAELRVAQFKSCMSDDGWATIQTDTGEAYKFDDAQHDAFLASNSRCLKASGLNEPLSPEPDAESSYRAMINMHACLVEAGFAPGDPPLFRPSPAQIAGGHPTKRFPSSNLKKLS